MNGDVLNEWLRWARDDESQHVLFVTGRPNKYRSATAEWLCEHFRLDLSEVYLSMRPDHNKQPSPQLKVDQVRSITDDDPKRVWIALDDRQDVLEAYREWGVLCAHYLGVPSESPVPVNPPVDGPEGILQEAAAVFAERNAIYKDNYKKVGAVMRALFPDGVPPDVSTSDTFHLFELIMVKLTRFVNSGMTHADSITDVTNYAAMIAADLKGKQK